ncbi:hypothetical protein MSAN_00473500 [Mycena sanguinolenta]|uniref:Uncharacterized protein n=1 Tax=Mycena sanguinolenta TaxID=230812 RepID=A0A8H7DLQ2_9AGAR|nr:hypothetical protein MSAN_00473500 [Mycena sanguinolenta]
MRFRFPSRARLKLKPLRSGGSGTSSDILQTSLLALKESADVFPPLKTAVGGVIALWDIAERAKYSETEARSIAERTQEILDVFADAIPDPSAISLPMLESIIRFTVLLDEIKNGLERIEHAKTLSRIRHLNRNARTLEEMKIRLDEAYMDFVAASTLRSEVQHHGVNEKLVALNADVNEIRTVVVET